MVELIPSLAPSHGGTSLPSQSQHLTSPPPPSSSQPAPASQQPTPSQTTSLSSHSPKTPYSTLSSSFQGATLPRPHSHPPRPQIVVESPDNPVHSGLRRPVAVPAAEAVIGDAADTRRHERRRRDSRKTVQRIQLVRRTLALSVLALALTIPLLARGGKGRRRGGRQGHAGAHPRQEGRKVLGRKVLEHDRGAERVSAEVSRALSRRSGRATSPGTARLGGQRRGGACQEDIHARSGRIGDRGFI